MEQLQVCFQRANITNRHKIKYAAKAYKLTPLGSVLLDATHVQSIDGSVSRVKSNRHTDVVQHAHYWDYSSSMASRQVCVRISSPYNHQLYRNKTENGGFD